MQIETTLDLRSMLMGFSIALGLLIVLGHEDPHLAVKDKYQVMADHNRFLILNTVNGQYIIEDDFSDRIRWYKADFESSHKNGWRIPVD